MALKLLGKGSILDTVANAAITAPKDIGDLVSEGAAKLTGNQTAYQNASNALKGNDSNLSGENVATDLGGLSEDTGVTSAARAFIAPGVGLGTDFGDAITGDNDTPQQAAGNNPTLKDLANFATNNGKQKITSAREIAGNTLQTAVNIGTLAKGKALEQGFEGAAKDVLGNSDLAKVGSRIFGGSATGGTYGFGSGTSNAVGTAENPKQALEDIIKPTVQNAEIGGTVAGITAAPTVAKVVSDHTTPLDESGAVKVPFSGINDTPVPAPGEPNVPEGAEDAIHANNPLNPPEALPEEGGPTAPVAPPMPSDILDSNQAAAQLDHDMNDPSIDWGKVQGANKAALSAVNDRANDLQSMDKGAKGGQMVRTADDFKRVSEHTPFYSKFFQETGHAPRRIDYVQEADRELRTGNDEEALNYQNLLRHAKAEEDVEKYQQADKATGYNRAKHQIPKGVPARGFIKNLYEKTHSPEFSARNEVGVKLKDVRDTLQGVKALRDKAEKDYKGLTKKGSTADEPTIRGKAAELRSQNTRYNILKAQEGDLAGKYKVAATALDEKYPDINLSAKKGVRLTTNTKGFETTKPVYNASEPLPPEPETKSVEQPPEEPQPTKKIAIKATDDRSMGHALGLTDEQMDAADRQEVEDNTPTRNADGDRAILEGIKKGDSDAYIVKSYMDATGATEEEAKKAYGLIEEDPNAPKYGNPENNPYYGKIADYKIENGEQPKSLGKILMRSKTVTNRLLNKALLRSTAYGDHLAYKVQDANHLWSQLSDKDQALADQLRGHSIESLVEKAKDPEAFKAYADRAKDIEDYIHAARGVADPYDTTPYRMNYGAGFHLTDEKGEPTVIDQYEGQEHAFQKARNFNNYEDIEKNTGLKRGTANFNEDLTKDVSAAQFHTSVNSLYYGLKDAFGSDKVSLGTRTADAKVPLKDFSGIFADKDIADRINSRANYVHDTTDALGKLNKGYDTANAAMKNIKLSMGGFHNINEMLNQAALNPEGAANAGRALVDQEFFRQQMNEWDRNGTMEKALHSGLTLGGGSEFTSNINKAPVIKQFHEALFGRQIPFSKMQVFERFTKGLDLNKPDDYEQMRGVARGINNTFGGINRLVDGLSSKRQNLLGKVVLAEDYNEGQIRTLLTAMSKGGIEGNMARQVVIGRMVILALPGTIQAVVTHKIGNNPKQIAEFVANQLVNPTVQTPFKTAGGTPKQVSLIAGIVNKIDRAVQPAFEKNNPNKLSGVESEISGNASPALSLIEEEKANKDYYGNTMHGQGMSFLQDIGQTANAAAPIPFSPGARALEGTRYGKNGVVKILSGGQSAITPEEAAIDISGVGRVSANPNSPEMVIMNNRQLLSNSLNQSDRDALAMVHPSWSGTLTKAQENAVYANKNYEINKWNVLRQNSNVYSVLQKQNQVAMQHGQPGDPLMGLSKQNYDIVTEYEFLKHADLGTDANNTAAVMYSENSKMINNYEGAEQKYGTQMNALYDKTAGIQGSNEPVLKIGGTPQYQETPQQTNLSNQYFGLANSTQRAEFLNANPQLVNLFNAQFQADNDVRAQQDEPLLKGYPNAPTALNTWMNTYIAASKADRTSMRNGAPATYNAMSNYLAQVDEYELSKTAGQAQFQGQNLSQSNLKDIYDLGQYDIAAPPAGASGEADTYVVDPQKAYAESGGGSGLGGGSSSAESLIQKLENEDKARDIKNTVKYAYNARKVKIAKIKKPYPIKVVHKIPRSKSLLKPLPKKIALKSVPTQ